jgi:hypothetical protein
MILSTELFIFWFSSQSLVFWFNFFSTSTNPNNFLETVTKSKQNIVKTANSYRISSLHVFHFRRLCPDCLPKIVCDNNFVLKFLFFGSNEVLPMFKFTAKSKFCDPLFYHFSRRFRPLTTRFRKKILVSVGRNLGFRFSLFCDERYSSQERDIE